MAFHFFHVKSTLKAELLEAVGKYFGVSDEVILFESTAINGSEEAVEGWMGSVISAEAIVFVQQLGAEYLVSYLIWDERFHLQWKFRLLI